MAIKLCPSCLRFPFRYYVMIMTALGGSFMFISRYIINVAILAMVNVHVPMETNFTAYVYQNTLNSSETEPISVVNLNSAPTFDWNQAQQGIIIGSYFYSYTILQISTGFLADKFNVIKLTALSQLLASLATLAIPLAAMKNYYLLILVRIILGVAHASIFPCLYITFEKWFTPQEKAFAQSLGTFASNFGVAIGMPITTWLCENGFAGGWPSAFYSVAAANGLFAFILYTTLTATPNESSLMSEDEKKFLASHVVQIPKRKVQVPWISMFKSIPLWSVSIARGIASLGYHTVNTKVPIYLETILNYKLQGNGLINSAFYMAIAIGQLICGPLAKYIAAKNHLELSITRKLFETIALLGPALFLMIIPLLSNRPEIVVIGLVMVMFTMGGQSGGDVPIVPEMAPGLVGTVFGFANTFSCASGFLAPMAIGAILDDQIYSESKWNLVFYISGSVQIFGAILFDVFATPEPQSWALVENTTKVSKSRKLVASDINSTNNNNDKVNDNFVAIEMMNKSIENIKPKETIEMHGEN